jgi:methylene-tetrahydromethanopterin dehydrogenase
VPPAGIEGVGVMDAGAPLRGTAAMGWGALAIGNVKYQTQHRLFVRMIEAGSPQVLGIPESFALARDVAAAL